MLVDHINAHAEYIQGFNQNAFPWRFKNNGIEYLNITNGIHNHPDFANVINLIPEPISREQVVACFQQDMYMGFIATMLWGYKHKMTTVGFEKILSIPSDFVRKKLNEVKDLIDNGQLATTFSSMCGLFSGIDFAYYTKLMYFIGKAFPNTHPIKPLILDNQMLWAYCDILLDQLGSGGNYFSWTYTLRFRNRPNGYVDYCNRMNNLAEYHHIETDRLESYIFSMRPADPNTIVYQSVYERKHLI